MVIRDRTSGGDLPVSGEVHGGEQLDVAELGWHGIEGDRRLALRRMDDRRGFPWLTASKLPELVLFTPQRDEGGAEGELT
jgi:uncharacterized protein YcbX